MPFWQLKNTVFAFRTPFLLKRFTFSRNISCEGHAATEVCMFAPSATVFWIIYDRIAKLIFSFHCNFRITALETAYCFKWFAHNANAAAGKPPASVSFVYRITWVSNRSIRWKIKRYLFTVMSIIHQAAGGIGAFKVGVGQPPLQSTRSHSILQANVIASYLSGGGGAFQEKRGFSILWTTCLVIK